MQTTERVIEQFSIEAEQSVLGALLQDNDAIDRMGDVHTDHFYRGDHRTIFAEILRQVSAGKACDVISLNDAIGAKVEDCLRYLNDMVQNTPSSANIGRYSAIVRDRAIKRSLMALGNEITDMASGSIEEASVLVDRAAARLEALAISRSAQEPVRVSDEMLAHIEELERRREGTGAKPISTGYPDLDRRLSGGPRRGELIVVAGRPKMGKTAFVLNVANHIAVDYSVLVLSMEMPKAQLHDRNLASIGKISLSNLLQPAHMTDAEWGGLTQAVQKLTTMNLYLDDQGGLRLLDVRVKARLTKRKYGLDVMVVDYLQLMEGDGDNRNAQIEGITRGLKALAKELDIAIILLSQLNRELEKRPNKRPQPSDLRDSGAIEQDADAVIFLYRDEVYNPDSMDKGTCEVDVSLCRQGAPGRVALTFIGDQARFESAFHWQPPAAKVPSRRGAAEHL